MKKGFPSRILGIPFGWEDRGKVSGVAKSENITTYTCCGFCKEIARIGIEDKELFLFCKKCKRKINNI